MVRTLLIVEDDQESSGMNIRTSLWRRNSQDEDSALKYFSLNMNLLKYSLIPLDVKQ